LLSVALFPVGLTGHHVHRNKAFPTGKLDRLDLAGLTRSRLPQTTVVLDGKFVCLKRQCSDLVKIYPGEPISTEVVFGGKDEKFPSGDSAAGVALRQKTDGGRYRYFHLATPFPKADIAQAGHQRSLTRYCRLRQKRGSIRNTVVLPFYILSSETDDSVC
jgi:hypothetical protein